MGAQTFYQFGKGKTAKEAFIKARSDASWEHGHGGYTGTLAEKTEFVMIHHAPRPDAGNLLKEEAYNFANDLIAQRDPRVDDKWGPAGCIQVSAEEFLFFGWASS